MKMSLRIPQTTGLIFLVGVGLFALGIFQILSIPSLRQKIGAAESNLAILRQKNEKLSEILSEIKTIESNLEAVQVALPATDEVPALIMQLEQIAKQSGLTVQHLGFGEGAKPLSEVEEAKSGGEVKKVSVTAVVSGSYASLQTFLKNLEETSRVVNVTNFRFSPGQEGGLPAGRQGESGLSITLGVEAFYLAEVESVAPETPLTLDTTSKEYIGLIRKVKALRVYRSEVSQ